MVFCRQNLGTYLCLFFGGLVWDSVITLELLFISERIISGVFLSSFALTYIVVLMYNRVLVNDAQRHLKLFVLALSSALGASLTTCYFDIIHNWLHSLAT